MSDLKGVKHLFYFNEETKIVELANDDDSYYVEYFNNPERLKEFIDRAKEMLNKLILVNQKRELKCPGN